MSKRQRAEPRYHLESPGHKSGNTEIATADLRQFLSLLVTHQRTLTGECRYCNSHPPCKKWCPIHKVQRMWKEKNLEW